LVVNARDAMPLGGKIVIETANVELDETYAQKHLPIHAGSYVMLTLTDTGSGIEKSVLSQIFEPFFTTKPQGEGTGLGLSMVYGVVRQSGGTISVYSEIGHGTAFKIYFPRVEESAIPLVSAPAPMVVGGSETILLVEDEDALRELTAELLQSAGYRVLQASTGKAGFERSERYRDTIHLLLTDVIMPGGSGSELAVRVKQSRPDVKVLYMSGYTGNMIGNYGVLEASVTVLEKPFTKQTLLTKVRFALDREMLLDSTPKN
jgi:two-component system cell cycle sensor histidine kinase/response regulator CckA